MNYAVKTDRICTAGIIYEDSSEQSVEADLTLPDYCPDIQKILKCRIEPKIERRSTAGDRIEIEGESTVRVIYVDGADNTIRCAEQICPFVISANLSSVPQSAVILTDTRVSFLNCRALSPRRLSIHGSFFVDIKVIDQTQQHICTHVKGNDIQQRKRQTVYSSLQGIAQQQFSVTEALEMGQSGSSVQSIIRSDIRIVKKDHTVSSGKLMYKGELLVKLLYIADLDSGKIETLDYTIPFSQVISAQGADKGELMIKSEVLGSSVSLRTEIGFDNPLPVLSARLCVTVFSFEKTTAEFVSDCYSTKYRTDCKRQSYTLPTFSLDVVQNVVEKTNVDFTDGTVSRVIDVWCESGSALCENVGGKVLLRGKYNICVLAQDEGSSTIYTERTIEYSRSICELDSGVKLLSDVSAEYISAGFRISSDKRIDVRTELLVTGAVYELRDIPCVTEVTADESSPCLKNGDAALILYYADKGEDIWDIARDYATSAQRVIEENDMSDDLIPEDMMIMLPV